MESEFLEHALDLFSTRGVEKDILGGRTIGFRPFSESDPLIFNLESQGKNQYLKIDSVRCNAVCQILNEDGTLLDGNEDISIVNMFPSSLFQIIDIVLNNIPITELTSHYANYVSAVKTFLSYNTEASQTNLQGQMFIPDDAYRFDSNTLSSDKAEIIEYFKTNSRFYTPDAIKDILSVSHIKDTVNDKSVDANGQKLTEQKVKEVNFQSKQYTQSIVDALVESYENKERLNSGFVERAKIIKGSKKFDYYIPLANDFLQSDRLLHPSVNLKIVLGRAPDSFSILSLENKGFTVKITDLKMFARYVTVSDKVVEQHEKKINNNEPLIYPIAKTMVKTYNLPPGERTKYISNMFMGVLPKSIIVTFVLTDAFHGNQSLNPYNFNHHDMSGCELRVNGESIPGEPIAPDFENDIFLREYMELYRNVGIDVAEDAGNIITPALYKSGMFFMCFDLTGDQCNMLHRHKREEGNIDAHIIFKKALPKALTVLALATFDADLEITKKQGPIVKYY